VSSSKTTSYRFNRLRMTNIAKHIALIAIMLPAMFFGQSPGELRVITIHATKFEFRPSEITLHVGERTKLVFFSDDVDHGLSVDGLPIDIEIHKKSPTSIVVTPEKLAELTGICSIYCGPGHSEMILTVHIVN
jgi:cytochrome c oxidase subunit 2